VYPPHAQIWFFIRTLHSFAVYNYITKAWVKFKPPGSPRWGSAFYVPGDGMYLGCNDGYIYKYDTGSTVFKDNTEGVETDIDQQILTKVFEKWARYYSILMKPTTIQYQNLEDGTGTFTAKKNWGINPVNSDYNEVALNFTASYTLMPAWAAIKMAAMVSTLMCESGSMNINNINYDSPPVDNLQFSLDIASGAIKLQNIIIEIQKGAKR